MPQMIPFLMFEGRAEEAMQGYMSVFPDSRLISISRYGPEGPGPEGTVAQAFFELNGQTLRCFDSFVQHAFTFTPSISLFVTFEQEAELDEAFAKLAEGGQVLMPLGAYPFSRRYGWLNDRFGVSWQLSLD